MRNPLEILLPFPFLLLLLLSVSAADLKTYRDIYQKNTTEIRQSYPPKFDDLKQQYQNSLEALKGRAQGEGDFKTVKAVFAESERFRTAKTLPPSPNEKEIPEIKAFQDIYVKQYTLLEMKMIANLGDLTVKYGQALDRLLKALTQAGKMTEAAAVEAELAKTQSAIKDFTEQLDAFKMSSATNAPHEVAKLEPVKSKPIEINSGVVEAKKPSSKKENHKNFVVNSGFDELVDGKPVGWENTKVITVMTEKK